MRDRLTQHASSGTSRSHILLAAAAGATALGWGLTARRLLREQTDDLTGLPTRRRFTAKVERQLRRRSEVRLVMLDLNEFKTVNDVYGHAAGNVVLWHTAQRLTTALSTRLVTATRLHGDEFAALIKHPQPEDLHLIRHALSSPVKFAPQKAIPTSASVGGVLISPGSGATVSSALRAADQHMYLSKSAVPRRQHEPAVRPTVRLRCSEHTAAA